MKKTYFIKTFRINNCLIVTAILSIMVRILLEIMNILLLSDENSNLIDYTQFIKKYVLLFENSLDKTILIVLALLLLLILPELVFRITKDSLLNYIKSYWITFRLRKFLIKQTNYKIEIDSKTQKV